MAITYKQYSDGKRPNLKHSDGLVLGWLVEDRVSDLEYRYALDKAGRVLRSEAKLGADDFDPRQRTWWPVSSVPPCAQFIGHYNPPRKIAKAG